MKLETCMYCGQVVVCASLHIYTCPGLFDVPKLGDDPTLSPVPGLVPDTSQPPSEDV